MYSGIGWMDDDWLYPRWVEPVVPLQTGRNSAWRETLSVWRWSWPGHPQSAVLLIVIVVIVYAASLLTTYLPAWQASRIYPAEALRYE